MWHHVSCFAKLRAELAYFESADKLPGFAALGKEEQADAKKHIPAIKQEEVVIKKAKLEEDEVDGASSSGNADKELDKKIKNNTKIMYKYRDWLKTNLSKAELVELLEHNDQSVPPGLERCLDNLADFMTFGCLKECPKCKSTYMKFGKQGYVCRGDLSEWTKCLTLYKEPARRPFSVPSEYKENFGFLKKYKYAPKVRVFREAAPSDSGVKKEEDENAG